MKLPILPFNPYKHAELHPHEHKHTVITNDAHDTLTDGQIGFHFHSLVMIVFLLNFNTPTDNNISDMTLQCDHMQLISRVLMVDWVPWPEPCSSLSESTCNTVSAPLTSRHAVSVQPWLVMTSPHPSWPDAARTAQVPDEDDESQSCQQTCVSAQTLPSHQTLTTQCKHSHCPLNQCVGGLNDWSMSLSQHTAVNVHSTSVWVVRMAKSVSVAQHTRIINALYSMKQYTIIMPSSLQTVYVTCLTVMISARNRYLDTHFNTWVSLSTRLYFLKS